jgi:hypothetical protein
MNRFVLFSVPFALVAAFAFADTPTESSKMTFRDVGAERRMSVFEDTVTSYRFEDMVLVIVKDSVICGQKAIKPSFAIKGDQIALHYDLTPAPPGTTSKCILASEFMIENAPHRDLNVSFSDGTEAPTVVSMQKCSNYNPRTDDVWQCLVPAKKATSK